MPGLQRGDLLPEGDEKVTAEKTQIGNATLYCGDCAVIAPTLGRFDLLLTDPPYGISADRCRGSERFGWVNYGEGVKSWDEAPPDGALIRSLVSLAGKSILWGGNYFADNLPATMGWLVWDKGQRNFSLADCELAWTSMNVAARVMTYARAMALKDGKEHPTQKPIAVMKWCVKMAGEAQTVFDPFMGSGTTGIACHQMGKTFTGIEREPKYFDIACRRIEDAQRQNDMFQS